jgi:hypothetical protein
VAITGQGAVASSLSTAKSVHEKILAEAGWKLEKTFGGILDAALAQQRKAHEPIIPMLPPLLRLPYHQECSDTHLAATIQQAFTYESSEEGKLGACAAFATLFCQQACKLCPARAIPGIGNGRPEELEAAAKEIFAKWDRLITSKNHKSQANHARGLQHLSDTLS